MKYRVVESSLGTLVMFARKSHLSSLDLFSPAAEEVRMMLRKEHPEAEESPDLFNEAEALLRRYASGEEVCFAVPVDLSTLKPFTVRVLTEIRRIPYGRVVSYGTIARNLGYSNAAQAVGQALKRNPIPIVVPCHRVVRGDGSLGGFGMGPDMKTKLLLLEGICVRDLYKSMVPS